MANNISNSFLDGLLQFISSGVEKEADLSANQQLIAQTHEYTKFLIGISGARLKLQRMVANFIPSTFNDALQTEWKKFSQSSMPFPAKESDLDNIGEKILINKEALREKARQLHDLHLDLKEDIAKNLEGSPKGDILNMLTELPEQYLEERADYSKLFYLHLRKRLLPYFVEVHDVPEVKQKFDQDNKWVAQQFSAMEGIFFRPSSISKNEFSHLHKTVKELSSIYNAMLEHQLNWRTDMQEYELEGGANFIKNFFKKEEKSRVSEGQEKIAMSPLQTLIGETISIQAKLANLSLLESQHDQLSSPVHEKEDRLHQRMYNLNQTLFAKSDRFAKGLLDLFSNSLKSHKDEEAIPRIRSLERRANSLAREFAGFITMLEQNGFEKHVDVFKKLEERLNDVNKITAEELLKRGAELKLSPVKKKTRTPVENKLRQAQKKKTSSPSAAARTSSDKEKALENDDHSSIMVKEDEGNTSCERENIKSEGPVTQPLLVNEEKEVKKNQLRQEINEYKQLLQEKKEELHQPLEEKIQRYLKIHTKEPFTKQGLDNLKKNLNDVKNIPATRRDQALLENYGEGMVNQLVQAEMGALTLHGLWTEETISRLEEMKELVQGDLENSKFSQALAEEIEKMKQDHVALEIDICETCIYPSEAAVLILLKHKEVTMAQTEDAAPYFGGPRGSRGLRGLMEIFQVTKKDGKLYADVHRHYEGNPETREAFLTPDEKRRYTVTTIKHPDVRMNGRSYVDRVRQEQQKAVAVHRMFMSDAGFRIAMDA